MGLVCVRVCFCLCVCAYLFVFVCLYLVDRLVGWVLCVCLFSCVFVCLFDCLFLRARVCHKQCSLSCVVWLYEVMRMASVWE